MKDISQTEELEIPEGVDVKIASRIITVSGPRGTLKKPIKAQMDIQVVKSKKSSKVILTVWHAGRKHSAALGTIRSLINNLITGVTKGFRYKMRAAYAHFPINCIIQNGGDAIEIRNFLGEKAVRRIQMLEGVKVSESKAQKDELILEGSDLQFVSQSAASIQQSCNAKNKDYRKFLDGIYVSDDKGHIDDE